METKPIVIHGREAFYIKKKDLPYRVYEGLIRDYSFHFFEERVCNDCELKPHRDKDPNGLTPTCEECAAHLGTTIMARDEKVGKNTYLRTPIGNWAPLKKRLLKASLEYTVKRHHPRVKMKRPIRFKGTYRAKYQEEAVEALVTKKRGVLRAPPRSGKTVMGSAAVCVVGEKTIIIASQREWLLGFQETFIGSDTQPALTTCKPSQIGICKTYADFLKYDVCLVTVQTFYNESGQRLLKKIRDMFSIAIVDECFPKGTPVATDKGAVPIETVAQNPEGYKALSFNHESETWEYKQVVRGYPQKTKKRLMRITVGEKSFVCTEDHEVWSVDRQEYIKAKELKVGESLLQAQPTL